MTTHLKTLVALVGMIVGVVISEATVYGSELACGLFLLGIAQLGIFFFERHRAKKNKNVDEEKINKRVDTFSIPLMSGIFFMAIALLIVRVQFSTFKNNFLCEKVCTFSAVLTTSPSLKNEYQIFSVRPDEKDVYDVQVKVPLYPRFEVGGKVTLTGKVTPPHAFMPHEGSRAFDYETYLRLHFIGSEMFYPKIALVESDATNISFIIKLQRLREYFVKNISLYVSEPAASLASGMLFGANSMSEELTQTFRVAGISHIIVLSGFNVAILISFVLLTLSFLPLVIRIVCAGTFVIFFVLMVGGEASIVRATIMSFIGLVALLVGRAYVARQALLVSLIAIILYEPAHLLYDVSLHLSFLATAGIVYMSEGIQSMLEKVHSKAYQEIISTTVSAYVATLPYVMYTFGTVSVYALLTNFIVLPVVPLMMFFTFLVVFVSPLSHPVSLILGYVDTLLGNRIIFVARIVESLPFASLTVSFSFVTMCIGYGLVIGAYLFLKHQQEKKNRNETLLTTNGEILSEVISY
jgi:competence protein ComEC